MVSPLLDKVVSDIFSKPQQKAPVPVAGQMVKGVGGGLADAVPAEILGEDGESQPAALSESEFVVPADVVSMLGDGSSEAGARILQDMINQIRMAKTGSKEQAEPLE